MKYIILLSVSLMFAINATSREIGVVPSDSLHKKAKDSLDFAGQVSFWALYNTAIDLPLWTGIRYIPQLNYEIGWGKDSKIDFEVSATASGTMGFNPFDNNSSEGDIKLYRGWARYSDQQLEIRIGLQKINFGSASMLRPLMWFDRVDPRDPLQLTEGVWGVLGRYYFLNNANLWLWGLYGNERPAVWEVVNTNAGIPELGGRLQLPAKKGEIGFSFHHRTADSRKLGDSINHFDSWQYSRIPENKIGLDGKFDLLAGLWFEATWTKKRKDMDVLTNQHILNIGTDYTFGIGNGLNVIAEHLVLAQNKNAFRFSNTINFSGLSLNYPIGLSDNLNAIIYLEWITGSTYKFISWKKQLEHFTFYTMLFINPEINVLPTYRDSRNLMGGTGIQIMIVYNH